MSTIDLEVMKQLIHEFEEKEALITEEVHVVQQQIDELKQRVNNCQAKLTVVNQDKEKIAAMYKRYANGLIMPANASPSNITIYPESNPTSREAEPAGQTAPHAEQATVARLTDIAENKIASKPISVAPAKVKKSAGKAAPQISKQVVEGWGETETLTVQPEKQTTEPLLEELTDSQAAKPDNEPASDETVKSINEALRGLFR